MKRGKQMNSNRADNQNVNPNEKSIALYTKTSCFTKVLCKQGSGNPKPPVLKSNVSKQTGESIKQEAPLREKLKPRLLISMNRML